jgi:predicted aldo/keto reductase-like oxidoreductase
MARDKEGMARDIDISLANLKTDYIDLYQIHNPTPADIDKVIAPGGALEALMEAKAAGKIGHIGITLHTYPLFEKALEMDWVETIMFPYNIVETQGEDLIAKCTEKNIGFICMKPLAGGAIEDATLALRFIAANDNVTVVIPGMAAPEEIAQNIAAVCDNKPLSDDEKAAMEAVRQQLGTHFCRRCNYCAPCTAGISIYSVFLMDGYLTRYGLADWARMRYAGMEKTASDCVDCGVCETRCPYNLPIRQMMKEVAAKFGK